MTQHIDVQAVEGHQQDPKPGERRLMLHVRREAVPDLLARLATSFAVPGGDLISVALYVVDTPDPVDPPPKRKRRSPLASDRREDG